MSIVFGSAGSTGSGTSSAPVPYPTGINAGDLLVLCVEGLAPGSLSQPTASGFSANGDNFRAVDVGSEFVCACILFKEATGSESGNLAVSASGWTNIAGKLLRYAKTEDEWTNLECAAGDQAIASNAYNAGLDSNFDPPDMKAGDFYAAVTGVSQQLSSTAAHALAASGLSFNTGTERADTAISQGNGSHLIISDHLASSGSSLAEPSYSFDVSPSAGHGVTILLRMREGESGGGEPTLKSVADSATVEASETPAIFVPLTRGNSATVEATEAIAVFQAKSVSTHATVRGTHAPSSVAVALAVSDSATVEGVESASPAVEIFVADSATVESVEAAAPEVTVSIAASGTVRGSELPFPCCVDMPIPDSGEVQASETIVVTPSIFVSNAAAVEATESLTVTVTVSVSTAATVRGSETVEFAEEFAEKNVADSATVAATEGILVDVIQTPIAVSDSATAEATEAISVSAAFTRANSGTVRGTESPSIAATIAVADSATPRATEAVSVAVGISVADSATVAGTELAVGAEREVEELTQMRFGLWGQLYGDFTRISTQIAVADSGTARATEAIAIAASIPIAASATTRAGESITIASTIAVAAPATIEATEALSESMSIVLADSATVRTLESIDRGQTQIDANDSAAVRAAEALSITAAVPLADAATVRATETPRPVIQVDVAGNATLRASEELAPVVAIAIADSAGVQASEAVSIVVNVPVGAIATVRATEARSGIVTLNVVNAATVLADVALQVRRGLVAAGDDGVADQATVQATEAIVVLDETPRPESNAIWIPNERPQTWEPLFRHQTFTLPPRTTTWTPMVRKPGQPITAA